MQCPQCGSGSTYHRAQTEDFRCRKCGATYGGGGQGARKEGGWLSNLLGMLFSLVLVVFVVGAMRACLCSNADEDKDRAEKQTPSAESAKATVAKPSAAKPSPKAPTSAAKAAVPPKSKPSSIDDDNPYLE